MNEIMIYECDKISDKYLVDEYFFYDDDSYNPHLKRYVRQVVDLDSGHRVVRTEYDESNRMQSDVFVDGEVILFRLRFSERSEEPRREETIPFEVQYSGYLSFGAKFLWRSVIRGANDMLAQRGYYYEPELAQRLGWRSADWIKKMRTWVLREYNLVALQLNGPLREAYGVQTTGYPVIYIRGDS